MVLALNHAWVLPPAETVFGCCTSFGTLFCRATSARAAKGTEIEKKQGLQLVGPIAPQNRPYFPFRGA